MGTMCTKSRVTKRETLVVLGHMNFAMQVIKPGRLFVSYLLRLAHSVPNFKDNVVITDDCKMEFWLWQTFLSGWNRVSMFIQEKVDSPNFLLY